MSALIRLLPAGPRLVESDERAFAPLAEWLAAPSGGAVLLAPTDDPFQLEGRLGAIEAIAVEFPKPTDGRGYSIAQLLRGRLGWRGELRAVGEVAFDQLAFLARCGFDAFALRDSENPQACLGAFGEVSVLYQGDVHDPRPLFRRRAEALAALGETR
jgi:uncharacterized protein (DUF934 family)